MTLINSPKTKIVSRGKLVKPPTDEELRALENCIDDPIYWFENHCFTQDQHRMDLKARRFPKCSEEPYLYDIIEMFHTRTKIAVPKSRQMMLSWVAVAYLLWATEFHRNVWTFFVSLKRSHAVKLVQRAKFIYSYQGFRPAVLSLVHHIERVRKDIGAAHNFPFYPPTDEFAAGNREMMSLIEGLSQDPEEIRMNTATYVMYDEDAFQPDSSKSHRAIFPALGDVGSIFDISTPNGKNHFYLKVFDIEDEQEPVKSELPLEIRRGLHIWENQENGYTIIRTHYTADKYKDPNRVVCDICGHDQDIRVNFSKGKCPVKDCPGKLVDYGRRWKKKTKAGMTEEDWQQEEEINFEVKRGKRVFPAFRKEIHARPFEIPPHSLLYRGWDFGRHHPAVVVCYDDTMHDSFQVAEVFLGYDINFPSFCDKVVDYCLRKWPNMRWSEGIDPQGSWRSGQGGIMDSATQSDTPKDYMENKWNLDVDFQNMDPRDAEDLLNECFRADAKPPENIPAFLIRETTHGVLYRHHPNTEIRLGTQVLIDGLSGHCIFEKHNDGTYGDKMVKNIYSHPANALEYAYNRTRKVRIEGDQVSAAVQYMGSRPAPPILDQYGAPYFG